MSTMGLPKTEVSIQIITSRACLARLFEHHERLSSHLVVPLHHYLHYLSKCLEQVEYGVLHICISDGVPLDFIFSLRLRMYRVSLGGKSLSCYSYSISYILILDRIDQHYQRDHRNIAEILLFELSDHMVKLRGRLESNSKERGCSIELKILAQV